MPASLAIRPIPPAHLPILRDALARASLKTHVLGVLVASTGRRAAEVRQMQWADVLLDEGLWRYRPGRVIDLSPLALEVLLLVPKRGPYVLPRSWNALDKPWSEDAAEKAWEKFRVRLPDALSRLTLTELRAAREAWLSYERSTKKGDLPDHPLKGVPFAMHQGLPDLSALVERRRRGVDIEGLTLRELCEMYLAHQLVNKASYIGTRRTLFTEFRGWLDRPAMSVSKMDVVSWHAMRAASPAQANRTLGMLRAAYNWAIRLDLLPGPNPTASIRRFSARSRMRFIQPEEMPRFMWAFSTTPIRYRAFIAVLLFTSARCGEARHMEWENVNLEERRWFKPKTKNGHAQLMALPAPVVALLGQLPRDSGWVFPGIAGQPLSSAAVRKNWAYVRAAAGLPDVTLHDLRRTCASWMAMNGVNLSTIQRVLNHASLTPTAIYARLNLDTVDEALQRVAEKMLAAGKVPEDVLCRLQPAR